MADAESMPRPSSTPHVTNRSAASVEGLVQAGVIHGDVNFHHPAADRRPVPRQLSPPPVSFVDRQSELAALDDALSSAGLGWAGSDGRSM
jgi:hypothetical protein